MKQRCNKHPMMWEPCKICAEITGWQLGQAHAEQCCVDHQNTIAELQ